MNSLRSLVFRELKHGIPVTDENDNRLGESTKAAQQAISQVVVSRILMASPGMGINIFVSSVSWWHHLIESVLFSLKMHHAIISELCLFSYSPVFNEPFGKEGLSEGRHISDYYHSLRHKLTKEEHQLHHR